MNFYAIRAIYFHEMSRAIRTIFQSFLSPVITTILYFVVFGSAIGSRMESISIVSYGSFIVPGLIMLTVMVQSTSNASFAIFFPKFTGTINEILSAPVSSFDIIISYVGAAATKSIVIGLIIFFTANLFVDLNVVHPFWMLFFLIITCLSFCMFGFIIGLFAKNFEHLQFTTTLILTPLIFLGGSFYSIEMLPKFWQLVSLFNPIVYLISGFRWAFFGFSDVSIQISIVVSLVFFIGCFSVIWIIFYTGYKIRN